MPELPDVELFRRHLAATSLHKEIERTSVSDPDMLHAVTHQALAQRLKGQQFETTHRHGKFLFVKVSSGDWLVLHFGMTGALKHLQGGDELPGHTRMLIEFTAGDRLAYTCQRKLGQISWTGRWETFLEEHRLGPDALEIELPEFRQLISKKRGTLKAALMDQSVVAGLGNVYSDEILFQMRLHPKRPAGQLDDHQLKQLYQTTQQVLGDAIDSHAQPDEMPSGFLLPHRDGDCPRCGNRLTKIHVSGRSAVYCPQCQSSH